jgi:predicted nuclease with TOPRIM domain
MEQDQTQAAWAEAVYEAREDITRHPNEHLERLVVAGDAVIAALLAAMERGDAVRVLEAVQREIEAIPDDERGEDGEPSGFACEDIIDAKLRALRTPAESGGVPGAVERGGDE